MPSLKTVLVVDDNIVNRAILSKILSQEFSVLKAENGKEAIELLNKHISDVAAVMLDLVMPVMDGFTFLENVRNDERFNNLPIIVTTESSNNKSEIKALKLGAWDFVTKPYNAEIIMFRLKNVIDRSQYSALNELRYLSEYDSLTGIYNKYKFFEESRKMIDESPDEKYAFLRFDVDRFQLINSFFGTKEGDNLLIYIAKNMEKDALKAKKAMYGRIGSDVFGVVMPYDKKQIENMVRKSKQTLAKYNTNYDIVPSIGIYVAQDNNLTIEEMYNRATLAAKKCKGNYVDFFAYYNENMSATISAVQEITNEMNFALASGQFVIYLQPQYNIHTNLLFGAEALVRWIHPTKGIISPGTFIPIFERNGFITKLDYYVWEQACKCLNNWIKMGINPHHISVNVSRVNIYNPNLVKTLLDLVHKYNIEPKYLYLELTESAYTDNPVAMIKTINKLKENGFTVMMDDFGSGYSSLSLLKDIEIDVLKIDMQFLSATDLPGRGENIIASVIRMSKWLNIPVIAEGAETMEQVDFLRSVGCDYVQGYYFAKPMPIAEYEKICSSESLKMDRYSENKRDDYHYDDLFSSNEEIRELFNSSLKVAAIYEFVDDKIEIIRVNEAYYTIFGHNDMLCKSPNMLELIDEDYRQSLLSTFKTCVKTKDTAKCEYMRHKLNGDAIWINTNLTYFSVVGNKNIIIGELTDITMRKELDIELQKYRESWITGTNETHTALIVDDSSINRIILKNILNENFQFLEAENGKEASIVLEENKNIIDLILLDITMPIMDGKEFLKYKKTIPDYDGIPVIMITADDSTEQQISTFSLGANDYLVKPFIPEVVKRRVNNVLESNIRFKGMVKEFNSMSLQVKTDLMTGLVNRISAEKMIIDKLENSKTCDAMLMLDIDSFKKINDSCGHDCGDKVIVAVANQLRLIFRKEDIVARMGGDEFAIFIENIPSISLLKDKAHSVCQSMSEIKIKGLNMEITSSIGIAITTDEERTFEILYKNADKALYSAKCHGRNTVSVYGEGPTGGFFAKWINDAESVLNAIDDCIYACDKDTYELIYANENICKLFNLSINDFKGKKCYEALLHKDAPCSFCSMGKMKNGEVYNRLFKIPNTDKIFLLRGRNIIQNGLNVHWEVAVDSTVINNIEEYFKEKKDDGKQ
ncbi:MAG: EAL domain-containing protein [Clostridia bacterium]